MKGEAETSPFIFCVCSLCTAFFMKYKRGY